MARVAALAIVLGIASAASAQAPTLDQLLTSFRAVHAMSCRYHEEMRDPILTTPVVNEGTLDYVQPGRLARRQRTAPAQVMLLDGSSLRISENGHVETMDLAAQPMVRAFVETFSPLLRGDRGALERVYTVTYAPAASGTGWTMTLAPRTSPLDRFVREIRFEGDGTSLRRMAMSRVDGVVTTTTFSDVDTHRTYSTAEAARVFSLVP